MIAQSICPAWASIRHPVIGMVHLPPLPGAPGYTGDLPALVASAVRDARALAEGGIDGVMIENFGDVPFYQDRVPAETVAAITRAASAVHDVIDLPLGINVLRNDALSAVAVAVAVGASFIRVNVLSGAAVTDQGVIEGRAAELARLRQRLGAESVRVFADVRVKHAAPLVERPIDDEVEELLLRGGADAVIASGTGTGKPTDAEHLACVKQAAGDSAVFVGSGAGLDTAAALLRDADGLIVGTSLKQDGRVGRPVDPDRVRALMEHVRGLG
ncbi:MAG: BtpA/SgcQ family protein [Planctomycetota bacterium]